MRAALKRVVVPALRARGFTGDLPHLRHITSEGTHTFSTRTWKWGGRFIVDLGRAPAGPYRTVTGEVIEPAALTSWHLRDADGATLRAVPDVLEETWFSYELTTTDRLRGWVGRLLGGSREVDPFDRAARAVLGHLPECDRWWGGEERLPHVRSHLEQLEAQGGPIPFPPRDGAPAGPRDG